MAQALPSTPFELAFYSKKTAEEYLSKQDEALHLMVSQNNSTLVSLETAKVEFCKLFDYWKLRQSDLERVTDQGYLSIVKSYADLYKKQRE